MLKAIPKSDISIRPFKAYKTWIFNSGSSDLSILYAVSGGFDYPYTSSANNSRFFCSTKLSQFFTSSQSSNPISMVSTI